MAEKVSEYQEEYCKRKGRWSNNTEWKSLKPCSKSYEEQPVGGRKAKIDDGMKKSDANFQLACSGCVCAQLNKNEKNFCCCICHKTAGKYPNMPVPSVHKLRYISENYVTADN
ncbi:hypothetical protein HELRODRAFT_170173 [Helobdella robusta]|uniref:Uncharacterized protein n=1 Tax=Helobdella robusta TaxID=6412 RepID=T1F2Q9_HELRO|nr:hypothetical protein HELRODRAFT_170173 [Helobdella robusta]ESO07646.1 hypothetical protein HELRODRAFT_170173 [Helobdella robusta]